MWSGGGRVAYRRPPAYSLAKVRLDVRPVHVVDDDAAYDDVDYGQPVSCYKRHHAKHYAYD